MNYTDFDQIPLFKYGVIMADPPWRYDNWSKKGEHKNAVKHYDCMATEDICAMNIGQLAAPNSVLFIWGTSPMLPAALRVINSWGFEYRGKAFCRAKTTKQAYDTQNADRQIDDDFNWRMNLGYGTRSNTEDCWLATTGRPKRLDKSIRELIIAPMREHSRKPDQAFDRASRLYAGPNLEAFSRQERPGWDSFGNEVDKFEAAV